jgi:uncharacterized membrane protein YhaH (DUF805 family)
VSDQPPLPDWTSAGPQPPVPAAPATPAGWYADPVSPGALRYWDGAAWTEHQSAAATTAWAPAAPAGASFGFGESVKRAFRKWSDFEGRATQSEFWWFYLFTTLVSFALYIPLWIALVALLSGTAETDSRGRVTFTGTPSGAAVAVAVVVGVLFLVASVVLFVVTLSLAVRRLHDTDRSGWWYLISLVPFGSLVLLYFFVLPPTQGPNQYGLPST